MIRITLVGLLFYSGVRCELLEPDVNWRHATVCEYKILVIPYGAP